MKQNKFGLALVAVALLPTLAFAGNDPVAASFESAFYNESCVNAYRTKSDQVQASFEREFGSEILAGAYRTKADQVLASFERDSYREPVAAGVMLAKVDPLDYINQSLNLGKNAVVASFERDLLGNAIPAATQTDTVMASFVRDLDREPVPVSVTVTQGDDIFVINEPDTILANFYRELHWLPVTSAVYVR